MSESETETTTRCIMCGTDVAPRELISNALANGAMPKMAEQALRAARLYTDELGALRKRTADLEAACRRVCAETDWCPVCSHHPSSGHHRGCALGNSTGNPPTEVPGNDS
jgi:hypothetical protein